MHFIFSCLRTEKAALFWGKPLVVASKIKRQNGTMTPTVENGSVLFFAYYCFFRALEPVEDFLGCFYVRLSVIVA